MLVVLVVGFVVVYGRFHDGRRVIDAPVLGTCTADADASLPAVTADLDTSACTGEPTVLRAARGAGWSVVTVALPSTLGLDPRINGVYVDGDARTVSLDYDNPVDESRREGAGSSTSTLVFVEIETSKLPAVPFTVEGATGPVTVTAAPGGSS